MEDRKTVFLYLHIMKVIYCISFERVNSFESTNKTNYAVCLENESVALENMSLTRPNSN